jgi:hypothetical protein
MSRIHMDPAGLALGITSVIALAAKGYSTVIALRKEYGDFDTDLDSTFWRREAEQRMFAIWIHDLLEDIIGTENTTLLLTSSPIDLETNPQIAERISIELGDLGPLVYGSIERAQVVLNRISNTIRRHFTPTTPKAGLGAACGAHSAVYHMIAATVSILSLRFRKHC